MAPRRRSVRPRTHDYDHDDRKSQNRNFHGRDEPNIVIEDVHQQSIWMRNLPLLYNRFVCTPLPFPSNICLALPAIPVAPISRRTPQYHKSVFDRARRLSSGSLTTHPSPPIDILVNSENEVFVVRLELPVDPPRAKTNDEEISIYSDKSDRVGRGLKVGNFINSQKGHLPSALGGAELIDIPNVITGHLVRRTVGVPIAKAVSADLWVTPAYDVLSKAEYYVDSYQHRQHPTQNHQHSYECPATIWRTLVAVKTDGGPIYIFDPREVMTQPRQRSAMVAGRVDLGLAKHGTDESVSRDSHERSNVTSARRRSSLSDADLLQAAIIGQPLEFPLFGEDRQAGENKRNGTVELKKKSTPDLQRKTRNSTSVHKSLPENKVQKERVEDEKERKEDRNRIIGQSMFKENRFTLILSGLDGTAGQVIWAKVGGGSRCISTYVMGCNEEGRIGIWDIPCNFVINGKSKDQTIRPPLYLISNAHSQSPVNSLVWGGSLHPSFVHHEPDISHMGNGPFDDSPQDEQNVQSFNLQSEIHDVRSTYPISFLSAGHDGAVKLWYSENGEDPKENMGQRRCKDMPTESKISDPVIIQNESNPPISDFTGCGRIGCPDAELISSDEDYDRGMDPTPDLETSDEEKVPENGWVEEKIAKSFQHKSARTASDSKTEKSGKKLATPKVRMNKNGTDQESVNIEQQTTLNEQQIGTTLKFRKFVLESIPLTAVTACPNSRNFVITGDWRGNVCRWALSQLNTTDLSQNEKTDRSRNVSPKSIKSDLDTSIFLQLPTSSYRWHSGPILKLKCVPSLPMMFFSVGFDRSIAFWDMTQQHRADRSNEDEHLVAIHGGHRLISVYPPSLAPDPDNDVDPCTGGVILDANWLSYDSPNPLGHRLSHTIKTTPLGLAPGGSSFGTAILSGVSVDDNNLLQVRLFHNNL